MLNRGSMQATANSSGVTPINRVKLDLLLSGIRKKLALNIPLTHPEMRLVEALQTQHRLKPREKTVFDGDTMHIVRSNTVDDLFDAVRTLSDIHSDAGNTAYRYRGSLDPITAAQWKKESGLKIGTKAFAQFAMKRMKDSDYRKFSA